MKKSWIFILLIGFSFSISAQSKREARKEDKRKQREAASARMQDILRAKQFVLEANSLFDRYGSIYQVSPNLNFIQVDGDNAVIQLGSDSRIGYNGVGGITVEGKVTKFDLSGNEKKGNYDVHLHVISNVGNYDIFLSIGAFGNAQARVSTNTSSRIRYSGDLVPLAASNVYVGNSIF